MRSKGALVLLVIAFWLGASVQSVAQRATVAPTAPTMLLDPSLENDSSSAIVVGCIMLGGVGSSSSIAVHPSSELADKSVKIRTPFVVRPTMGERCQLRGYRCVNGVAKISSYNPNSTSTNSNLPGQIFVSVNIEAVSKRDCGN